MKTKETEPCKHYFIPFEIKSKKGLTCVTCGDEMYHKNKLLSELKGKELLNDVLKEKQELIAIGGIRFTGITEEKIKQIFDKHGIKFEIPF